MPWVGTSVSAVALGAKSGLSVSAVGSVGTGSVVGVPDGTSM